jgi:hypothetical protein
MLAVVAAIAAAFGQSAVATAKPETLYTQPGVRIEAFAQDGPTLAWFSPGGRRCNVVHLRSLKNGLGVDLPSQSTRNVTCRFVRSRSHPVGLAIAGGRVLWTLPQQQPLELDYLLGASAANPSERRFHEIAHTARGVGQWLGGVAGDRDTLVYPVTAVDYEDEAACLAGSGPCTLTKTGGGVYRVVGRKPLHVPGTGPAVQVAAAGTAVAYVPTGGIAKDGTPRPGADLPISVVDARTGQDISSVVPQGVPVAIALSRRFLSTLERTSLGLRLAWYERATGRPAGSVPVSRATAPALTASDQLIVYRVGRVLRAVDTSSHRVRTLATAATTPVGLSLEGGRLAWAENLKTAARVRALYVSGRG